MAWKHNAMADTLSKLLAMRRKIEYRQNIKMSASIFVNLALAIMEARTMQASDVVKELRRMIMKGYDREWLHIEKFLSLMVEHTFMV